jgi:pimeloyl-ACP methyl ester carboxylesterase
VNYHDVRLGDLHIAYVREGSGPPLALVHGGISDARYWKLQIESLAEEFTVLAWDAPGCGESSDVPESWRLPDFGDALAAWLRAVGVPRAHLLGLSWGSSIVLECYRRHPEVVASLILASAYAGWAGSLTHQETAARLEGALAAADMSGDELVRAWPGLLSPDAPADLHEQEAIIADANSGRRHPGGYRASIRSMAEADLRDVLPTIGVPTLLVYGERDERSPLEVAYALHARIPAAELAVIPGVGHLANLEAPDEFDRYVRDFLRPLPHP